MSAEFGITDCEEGGSNLGASEEIEVQGYGVGLVLGREGEGTMEGGDTEKDAGYVTTVRN